MQLWLGLVPTLAQLRWGNCSLQCQLEPTGPSFNLRDSLCLRGQWGRCLYLLSDLQLDLWFTLQELGSVEIDCGRAVGGMLAVPFIVSSVPHVDLRSSENSEVALQRY